MGPMQNFVYLVGDRTTREVAVVDPAWDVEKILEEVQKEDLKLRAILVTHFHFDHTNGILPLLKKVDLPVYVHQDERPYFQEEADISELKLTHSGEKLNLGNVDITFLHTPGHTPGSQCFHLQENLVSGDTLFINCVGRTDLPGGNPEAMYQSISNVLKKLDDQTVLFPGHNYAASPTSTLGKEKQQNPYLLCQSLTDFLQMT